MNPLQFAELVVEVPQGVLEGGAMRIGSRSFQLARNAAAGHLQRFPLLRPLPLHGVGTSALPRSFLMTVFDLRLDGLAFPSTRHGKCACKLRA